MSDKNPDLLDWLGVPRSVDFKKAKWLGIGLTVCGAILTVWVAALIIGALVQLSGAILSTDTTTDAASLRSLGLIVLALAGAPFVIWRAIVAQKQAETAAASLANDKLNDAFNALAARHKVLRAVRHVYYRAGQSDDEAPRSMLQIEGQRLNLPENARVLKASDWETREIEIPDIVTRAAAIDRLEGLAWDQPENRDRIASILCLYVRETSATEDAPMTVPEDLPYWSLHDWAAELRKNIRTDRELAVKVLSQLNKNSRIELNLEGANLQGFQLSELDLRGAVLSRASIQGVRFFRTKLGGAKFHGSKAQGTEFVRAILLGAKFALTEAQGSRFNLAVLQHAEFHDADLRCADLNGADLQGTRFIGTDLRGADLSGLTVSQKTRFMRRVDTLGAAIDHGDEKLVVKLKKHLNQIFADGCLRDTIEEEAAHMRDHIPSHWEYGELQPRDFRRAWREWQDTLPDFPDEWKVRLGR
ncbi:pentapeptide repeat-containing protein [Actibacterium sp. 188UL27-1]|uniref:pentapeptide repeat-containing protein n=1 Tax=Actibacterium sp. 188UL27-1 TaxID=2786961 RepID=UPI00195EEC94|nr:pentapeptide repeat-containing protein [Actibacterium sp. 188UL27-1]MBM7066686.1 pentapeptide repeat-containing protein [Actibacterium sp. 188UL27-1]